LAAFANNLRNIHLGNNSANDFFPRSVRSHVNNYAESVHRRAARAKMPSSTGYLLGALVAAIALFLALWWMLISGGDEAPWIPAGLAASVVLLVALSAREVVMRRAWTRYLLEQGSDRQSRSVSSKKNSAGKTHSTSVLSAAWRRIQTQSEEADSSPNPESHFDVFQLCQDYLSTTDETLRSNNLPPEKRIAIRGGQDRIRSIQKHHLLTWARDSSRSLTYEAQQRARTSDKIEAANRALHCLESALKFYPDEMELNESSVAVREFIASVKVAHWVELAERSAFKGHYLRAIERYKDALFYLNRETVKEDVRIPGAERIGHEIELLQARLNTALRQTSDEVRESRNERANNEETDGREGTPK
jgi:tetratricopeptide (TPR) repeat protein